MYFNIDNGPQERVYFILRSREPSLEIYLRASVIARVLSSNLYTPLLKLPFDVSLLELDYLLLKKLPSLTIIESDTNTNSN